MKRILFLSIFVACSGAFADCPNISGTYRANEKIVVKYEQANCDGVTRFNGWIVDNGTPKIPASGTTYSFDGKPVCNGFGKCSWASVSPTAISFYTNYNAPVKTTAHGQCVQRQYNLSRASSGDLQVEFVVKECSDRFEGSAVEIFKKL